MKHLLRRPEPIDVPLTDRQIEVLLALVEMALKPGPHATVRAPWVTALCQIREKLDYAQRN
jgi:hypothetical protein